MGGGTDWMASRARLTPCKTAVVEAGTGRRFTYEEFSARIDSLAGYLQRSGLGRGDRIALLAPNGAYCLELLFAAGKIGAVFVPLNTRFSVPELAYVLNDCQPAVTVYHESFASTLGELAAQTSVPQWLALADYEPIVAASPSLQPVPLDLEEEEPWAIIYTGGTTGQAKGVVLSHRAILWNAINTVVSWGLTEQDVTPVYIPMFHTGGLNALAMPLLYAGGTVVIGSQFRADDILRMLADECCTIALFVPTMYHMLVSAPEFESAQFPHMHTFLSGGAPCPPSIYEAFEARGLAFKEGYGLTEAGPNNFYIAHGDVPRKRGSVGKPMLHNSIRLCDPEGREVAPGEEGEICIAGPHLFSGYWNKPDVTARTLVDGWLRTGDLGRRDEEGYHYIVGRVKDMIITGGENVYPLEVEQVLDAHPAVSEVTVVGLPDPQWGEVVTAVIVTRPGRNVSAEELKSYCAGKLAGYKTPKKFHIVTELPKTSVGKMDKKRLVQQLAEAN